MVNYWLKGVRRNRLSLQRVHLLPTRAFGRTNYHPQDIGMQFISILGVVPLSTMRGTNAFGAIHVFGGDVFIRNSIIRFSSTSGIFSNAWITLLDNHFSNNAREAIRLDIFETSSETHEIQGNKGKGNQLNLVLIQGEVNTDLYLGHNPGLPYVIKFLKVNPKKTLTIDKGTLIKLSRTDSNDASIIEVKGSLITHGTEDNPVIFTSLYDKDFDAWNDSNLIDDQRKENYNVFIPILVSHQQPYSRNYYIEQKPERNPIGGDWRGLVVYKGGHLDLTHTVIRYAGYPHSQITFFAGTGQLDHVRVEKGYLNGIYAEDTSIVMRDSIVSDHPGYGVKIHGKTEYIQPIIERIP